MKFSDKQKEQLNCLTCIEVDFKKIDANTLGKVCLRAVGEGESETFTVGLRFLALMPTGRNGGVKLMSTTLPRATAVLEPVSFERAGEVKGHVSICARINSFTWDTAAKVKPVDTLPHAIADVPNLDFGTFNVFDGTAFGEGTVLYILYDRNKLGTEGYVGYVNVVAPGAKYIGDAGITQIYVPESSGLRAENGMIFPYFGDLEDPDPIEVDLMAWLSGMDASLIEQALQVCDREQQIHGEYTAATNAALAQNQDYQRAIQAERGDQNTGNNQQTDQSGDK